MTRRLPDRSGLKSKGSFQSTNSCKSKLNFLLKGDSLETPPGALGVGGWGGAPGLRLRAAAAVLAQTVSQRLGVPGAYSHLLNGNLCAVVEDKLLQELHH